MLEGIAIVSQSRDISMRETARVSAAIQTQVLRDLKPWWDVSAAVNTFFRIEDVPLGQWPVVIRDDVSPATAGIHRVEGIRVGVAASDGDWTVAVSRLVLDLLVNPDGTHRVVGPSPESGQDDVEFVVAVGAVGHEFSYDAHRYPVSDFVYPAYYHGGSGPYDSTGAVTGPLQLDPGGCLTWWDGGSGRWWHRRVGSDGQVASQPVDIDADADMHRQLEGLAPRPTSAAEPEIDLRATAGARPTGATHRAQRLNDMLNDLGDVAIERDQRSAKESPNR